VPSNWDIWAAAMEGAADTLIWPLKIKFGEKGPLFPGVPEAEGAGTVPYSDDLVEADSIAAARLLTKAVEAQRQAEETKSSPSAQGSIRTARKALRCHAVAAVTLLGRREGLGPAISSVRQALHCLLPGQSASEGELLGGLLAMAGKVYMAAHRLGAEIGWDSQALPLSSMHPMVKPFSEATVEETIQRASLCYFQAVKATVPDRPVFDAAVRGLKAAYAMLGQHYLESGRYTKANRHFTQGIQLFRSLPSSPQVARLLASCVARSQIGLVLAMHERTEHLPGPAELAAQPGGFDRLLKSVSILQAARSDLVEPSSDAELWQLTVLMLARAESTCGEMLHQRRMSMLSDTTAEQEVIDHLQSAVELYSQLQTSFTEEVGHIHHLLGQHYAAFVSNAAQQREGDGLTSKQKVRSLHTLAIKSFEKAREAMPVNGTMKGHVAATLDMVQFLMTTPVGGRATHIDLAVQILLAMGITVGESTDAETNIRSNIQQELNSVLKTAVTVQAQAKGEQAVLRAETFKTMYRTSLLYKGDSQVELFKKIQQLYLELKVL